MSSQNRFNRLIERRRNHSAFSLAFVRNRRARMAVLFVPVVLFAIVALVRVQAASHSSWKMSVSLLQTADNQPAPPAAPALSTPAAPASAVQGAKVMPATGVALGYQGVSASPIARDASPSSQIEAAPASDSQNTFDRTLSFSGNLALTVLTGGGNITLTKGAAGQMHIHGIVKAGNNADPSQVQQIVANPPIEQNGNVIRIGAHQQNLHNISISYEIEAPADTTLVAATGSGNIVDQGVGQNAKLETGSGNINAAGLQGGFKAQTGSGDIAIDGAGQGDAKAQTGSGTIDLKGVIGALQAQTGSGTIMAEGKPSSPWKLETGSGSLELAIGNAPIDLDASVGSGKVSADQPMTMQSSADKHHVHAQLNGGGTQVRVETGSGNIRIH